MLVLLSVFLFQSGLAQNNIQTNQSDSKHNLEFKQPLVDFPAPRNLRIENQFNRIHLVWDAPIAEGRTELAYDDGTAEAYYGVHMPIGVDYFAMPFVHPVDFTLNEISCYLINNFGADIHLPVYVTGDISGYPDLNSIIWSGSVSLPAIAVTGDWYHIDIPDQLMSGGSLFHLVVQMPGVAVNPIGADDSASDGLSVYSRDNGSTWSIQSAHDWMFRATITSSLTSLSILNYAFGLDKSEDEHAYRVNVFKYLETEPINGHVTVPSPVSSFIQKVTRTDFNPDEVLLTLNYYDIYRSETPGGPYTFYGDAYGTGFTDSENTLFKKYYYRVDANYLLPGGISELSNEAYGTFLPPASGVLVWDGILNGADYSGSYVASQLTSLGYPVIYTDALPYSLIGYDAVFLSFGNYSSGYTPMRDDIATSVANYLENGGNAYLEGAEALGYNQVTNPRLLSLFGLDDAADGTTYPLSQLEGQSGALTSGMIFTASTQSTYGWIDKFTPNPGALLAFVEAGYGNVGVQSEGTYGQRTFCFSYSLANLTDGIFPSTRANLLAELADFLIIPYVTYPDINISTGSLSHYVESDSLIYESFWIYNNGDAPLEYTIEDVEILPFENRIELSDSASISKSPGDDENDYTNHLLKLSNSDEDAGWLSVSPAAGTIQPGSVTPIQVVFNSTGLAPGSYSANILVHSNDPDQPVFTIPASLIRSAINITTVDNENNLLTGTPDGDLDVYLERSSPLTPIEFNIIVDEPFVYTAQLYLLAYDVDETSGQLDNVYLNGHFIGSLTGANDTWSTTVLNVDPSYIIPGPSGKNLIQIDVDLNDGGWAVTIDWGQLVINNTSGTASIRQASLNQSQYAAGDDVHISLEIDTNLPSQSVTVESNILDLSGVNINGTNRTILINGTDDEPFTEILSLPADAADGSYRAQIIVYDAVTSLQQDLLYIMFTVGNPPESDFSTTLTITDLCQHTQQLVFGTSPIGTDGFDPGLDTYAPPAPPGTAFDARFHITGDDLLRDFRGSAANAATWDLEVRPATLCEPVSIRWDPNTFPQGNSTIRLVDWATGGSLVNLNMRYAWEYTDTNNIQHFSIIYSPSINQCIDLEDSWNLISCPVTPGNPATGYLFPNSSAPVYTFNGTYTPVTELQTGKGYWQRNSIDETVCIAGTELYFVTPALNTGWNLIAGLTSDIAVSDIYDGNGIIIPSTVYGFHGSYFQTDTIRSGKGYWIRASNPGIIYLDGTKKQHNLLNIAPLVDLSTFSSLKISDRTGADQILYFGSELPPDMLKEQCELPPVPPAGNFDARFQNNRWIEEEAEPVLRIQSDCYPLEISAELPDGADYILIAKDDFGESAEYKMRNGQSLSVINPIFTTFILVQMDPVPEQFFIHQNFPNPFNPSTTISYSIPKPVFVEISVYNGLGQLVKKLVSETMEPGQHQIIWNGKDQEEDNVSSGVYYYRISAGSHKTTKKMVFLK